MAQTTHIQFPDLLATWPWSRRINPHYDQVKEESKIWLESFNALSPKAQRAFNACDFALLTALCYPDLDREQLRTASDLMHLFFLYDEQTDVEDVGGAEHIANVTMKSLRNPYDTHISGEPIMAEVTRQFWRRAIKYANRDPQRRFVEFFDPHTKAITQQAEDRSHNYLPMRSIESYLELRRLTIATRPAFTILEFTLNLPEEVFQEKVIDDLIICASDLIIISNDVYSYPKEASSGDDGHNIITIVMSEHHVDLVGAINWVEEYANDTKERFTTMRKNIPSFGRDVDAQLAIYLDGVANFVRGHDSWCFESERYFGKNALDKLDFALRKIISPEL
ncbi:Terpene synthase [Abortiporus biennis]